MAVFVLEWVVGIRLCGAPINLRSHAPFENHQYRSKPTTGMGSDGHNSGNASSQELVYHLTKDEVQTRHLVVYNTGPAVGADQVTLRRVFEAYGEVERVHCPNPAAARVLITFQEVCTSTHPAFSARPTTLLVVCCGRF